MARLAFSLLILVLAAASAAACSFCGDGFARRQPLRGHFADAKCVLAGVLKNPKPNPDGLSGTTEFHVSEVLKADGIRPPGVVIIPRYMPVIGDTPADYLFFCSVIDGKLEPTHGVEGGPAVSAYLKEAKSSAGLAFAFRHLHSVHPVVAADAFLEVARTPDAELVKQAAALDRAKLRRWLADPATSDDRVGVYAMLLGLCGNADDSAWLAGLLLTGVRTERVSANLGGLLAGLVLLDPARGWAAVSAELSDRTRPFSEKLSAIGTLRYFQATRPTATRDKVIAGYRTLIEAGDLADLATDDLRRFGWWELSAVVFDHFEKPTHQSPATRRSAVRYALGCPTDEAKAFLAKVRAADPELVRKVEASQKLYEGKR